MERVTTLYQPNKTGIGSQGNNGISLYVKASHVTVGVDGEEIVDKTE